MCHYEVAATGLCFYHHFFCNIQRAKDAGTWPAGVPGKQARIIVGFLVSKGCFFFQGLYHFDYFHFFSVGNS